MSSSHHQINFCLNGMFNSYYTSDMNEHLVRALTPCKQAFQTQTRRGQTPQAADLWTVSCLFVMMLAGLKKAVQLGLEEYNICLLVSHMVVIS